MGAMSKLKPAAFGLLGGLVVAQVVYYQLKRHFAPTSEEAIASAVSTFLEGQTMAEQATRDIKARVLQHLQLSKPKEWTDVPLSNVSLSRLSAAISNMIFCFEGVDPDGIRHKALLRVYGKGQDNFYERDYEEKVFSALSDLGAGPTLIATFPGGRIEQFLEATALLPHQIRETEFSKKIGKELATFQKLPMPARELGFWKTLRRWHKKALELSTTEVAGVNLKELGSTIDRLERDIAKHKLPVVWCHNDLQHANILTKSDGSLCFIDYEYSDYNYRAFDIANHFSEWMCDYLSETPHIVDGEKFPNEQQRFTFYQAYLAADSQPVDDQAMRALDEEVMVVLPLNHLLWGFWSIIQLHTSSIEFEFEEYGRQRFQLFLKCIA